MNILVDTSVWSAALRRRTGAAHSLEQARAVGMLSDLIRQGRAVLIGAIRQELLSGIKLPAQFEALRLSLAAFDPVRGKPCRSGQGQERARQSRPGGLDWF